MKVHTSLEMVIVGLERDHLVNEFRLSVSIDDFVTKRWEDLSI